MHCNSLMSNRTAFVLPPRFTPPIQRKLCPVILILLQHFSLLSLLPCVSLLKIQRDSQLCPGSGATPRHAASQSLQTSLGRKVSNSKITVTATQINCTTDSEKSAESRWAMLPMEELKNGSVRDRTSEWA